MRRIFFVLLSLSLPSMAVAQSSAAPPAEPFGFHMGMSLAELRKTVPLVADSTSSYLFSTTTAPKPNSQFESYLLVVSPKYGLCKLSAIGTNVSTDGYGMEVKQRFSDIKAALTDKYGPSKSYDFLHAGSIWDENQDWMMGIAEHERDMVTFWDSDEHSTLPSNLTAIELQAHALSAHIGYVNVAYQANTGAACLKEMKAANNSTF